MHRFAMLEFIALTIDAIFGKFATVWYKDTVLRGRNMNLIAKA